MEANKVTSETAIITDPTAFSSGVMPRRMTEYMYIGSVLSRPVRKKVMGISSKESVKISSALAWSRPYLAEPRLVLLLILLPERHCLGRVVRRPEGHLVWGLGPGDDVARVQLGVLHIG